MHSLIVDPRVRHALDAAADVEQVGRIVRTAARHLVRADGATFVLADGDFCFYADEDAIAPLWKGQRFPRELCISGWAMIHGQPAVVPDIHLDPRIPLDAYTPTFVRSLVMTPVGAPAAGAIGAYWARPAAPTEFAVAALRDLAALTAAALARVGLGEAPWSPNFSLEQLP